MRIFKSRWFQRFARKEGITDVVLREVVARAEQGQIDADLGAGVIKQRLARPNQGRSKGYRVVVIFRCDKPSVGGLAFFVYGFAKSVRANLDADEDEQFKEAAKHVLALTSKQIETLLTRSDFVEVNEE